MDNRNRCEAGAFSKIQNPSPPQASLGEAGGVSIVSGSSVPSAVARGAVSAAAVKIFIKLSSRN